MKQTIKRVWRNEFFQGTVFITISSLLINILNYFFYFFLGRSLGPSHYGEIITFFSYISFFSSLTVVFSTLLIQRIGANVNNQYGYVLALEEWFFRKIKKYAFLFIPMIIAIPFMPKITNLPSFPAFIIFPMMFLSVVGCFYSAALQGMRLFFWTSMLAIIGVLFKLSGALAVYLGVDGINTIVVFMFCCAIFGLFLARKIIHDEVSNKVEEFYPKIEKKVSQILSQKQVLITAASVMSMTLFSNLDIIFVKKFFTAFEAGIFSSWSLFAKIILYAIGPIMQVSFIFFATSKNQEKQNLTLKVMLITLLVVGIFGYLFYSFFGDIIIGVFFGKKFITVSPYLHYAAIFGGFYTAISLLNNYFLAKRNNFSIILPLLIPFYLTGFFIIPKTLTAVINLNIGFSVVTAVIYLIVYLKAKKLS